MRLPLNQAPGIKGLVHAVGEAYGKRITLEPLAPDAWGALTAFLVEDEGGVTIYYRLQDSPQYRLQCICHELGHLAMGTGCSLPWDETLAAQVEVPETTIRLQARDLRDSPEERSAEEFAFVSIRRLRTLGRSPSRASEIWA